MIKCRHSGAEALWEKSLNGFLRELQDPTRLATIAFYETRIIAMNDETPIGCVQLHNGVDSRFGPTWLAVTMLGAEKVAVPIQQRGEHTCKRLCADPVCYGKWYPFSVLTDVSESFRKGLRPGQVQKFHNAWKLRCFAPDGAITWVPLPASFWDADNDDDTFWGG